MPPSAIPRLAWCSVPPQAAHCVLELCGGPFCRGQGGQTDLPSRLQTAGTVASTEGFKSLWRPLLASAGYCGQPSRPPAQQGASPTGMVTPT